MTWYIDQGHECDVVLSSRVRLARNVRGVPFPNALSETEAPRVADTIEQAFRASPLAKEGDYLIVDLQTLAQNEREALAERHLISSKMVPQMTSHRLIIRRDEAVSVMINEEDHIRVQAMQPGFDLATCYALADELTQELEKQLPLPTTNSAF